MVTGCPQPLHDAVCRRLSVDQPQVTTEGLVSPVPLSFLTHVPPELDHVKKRKRISRRRLAGQ